MSHTSIFGLLGDSIHNSFAPSSNAACASPAVGCKAHFNPHGNKLLLHQRSCTEGSSPKAVRATSPGRSTAPKTAAMAAIPDP